MSDDTELDGRGHLEDTVLASLFLLQHVERFRRVPWGDHTIGNLSGDDLCSREVAWRGESNEIAKRGHPIGTYVIPVRSVPICSLLFEELTSCPGICTSKWRKGLFQVIHTVDLLLNLIQLDTHRCASRGNVLERGSRRQVQCFLELFHQRIRIECIQEVDVSG